MSASDAAPAASAASAPAPFAPWLVAIDLQRVFADPASPWGAPRFADAASALSRLAPAFSNRVVRTRWVAPHVARGAWADYFAQWPFAMEAPEHPMFDLIEPFDALPGQIETRETFGKWDLGLAAATCGTHEIVRTLNRARGSGCRRARAHRGRRMRRWHRRGSRACARGDGALRAPHHPDHGRRGARQLGLIPPAVRSPLSRRGPRPRRNAPSLVPNAIRRARTGGYNGPVATGVRMVHHQGATSAVTGRTPGPGRPHPHVRRTL